MKNKGFTMIELLATITILGIISVIGISAVNGLIQKGRENYYRTQKNNLIAAAKSYYQANKSALPKSRGEKSKVTYGQLKSGKFIGKMYAADKKTECNPVNTFVEVTKIKNGKYKYTSYLSCKEKNESPTTEADGTFTAVINPHPNATNTDIYYDLTVSGSVTAKHYSYTVTKNGFHYTGPIEENVNSTSFTTKSFTIDKNSNNPLENVFMVTIKITDKSGKVHRITKEAKIGDTKDPECTYDGDPNHLPAWSKGQQTIRMKCTDPTTGNFASGCEKDVYKVVLKNKADVDKYKDGFTIRDKAGHTKTCEIKKYIRLDFEPPTCPSAIGYEKTSETDISSPGTLPQKNSNTWSKKWILTTATGSVDHAAGIANNGVGGVYYKVTTRGKTENVTGLKQSYRNVDAEGESTVTYQACDALDNCTTNCGASNNSEYVTKLDRTAPKIKVDAFKCDSNNNKTGSAIKTYNAASSLTVNSSTMPSSHNEWLNNANYANGVCFTTTYTDESAIAKREWKFNAGGKKLTDSYQVFDNSDSPKTKTNFNTTNKSSYTTSESYDNKLNAQGVRYGEFIVQDAAGNEAKATITMKIDKEAPTISTNVYKCKSDKDTPDTAAGLKGAKSTSSTATIATADLSNTSPSHTWLNLANYPYGVCMTTTITDNNAIAKKYTGWNDYGQKCIENDTTYKTIPSVNTSISEYNITTPSSFKLSGSYSLSLTGDGHRFAKHEATDIAGNVSTLNYSYKLDKTPPSVTLSGDSDNYKITEKTTTKVSPIDKIHWDSNSWSNITNVWERETSLSGVTSGTRAFYAMDTAENVGYATRNAYKLCDTKFQSKNAYNKNGRNHKGYPSTSLVAQYGRLDGLSNYNIEDIALAFHWVYKRKNCTNTSSHRPTREYTFQEIGCNCYRDGHTGKFCPNGYIDYIDYTAGTHTDSDDSEHTSYIYYIKAHKNSSGGYTTTTDGQYACDHENHKSFKVNEYVYQVCKYGTDWKTDKESGKTTLDYHGYRWYKGKAGTYDSWDSEYWTHNGGGYDDRVKRSAAISSACEKACANKFD